MSTSEPVFACSSCFMNEGLQLDANRLGMEDSSPCPRCAGNDGRKLTASRLARLAQEFFVWGSVHRSTYGAAPRIQFNGARETDIDLPGSLGADAAVFEDVLGIGFFLYGPRLWMLGEIEPLKALRCAGTRDAVIERIVREYGTRTLAQRDKFYRIRKDPDEPSHDQQYDSPPPGHANGRLDTAEKPALYASPDFQTCLHECRVTAEDDLYAATLSPARDLELLDVTTLLDEPPEVSEFESLDLAVNMLFLAGEHSYPITRQLSCAAQEAGLDGIAFPSHFSTLRNGVKPFETTYGLSNRVIPRYKELEAAKVTTNFAIFGRPIQDGLVDVVCVNRVVLHAVHYSAHFGPVLGDEQGRPKVRNVGRLGTMPFFRSVAD